MTYYSRGYEPMPYAPVGGYGYPAFDTGYPMPVSVLPGSYDSGYYPYYSSRRHHGHRHHSRHHYPRTYIKHRTVGDRIMGMFGMPQAHLYRF